MGNEFGRTALAGGTGRLVQLSADGRPEWKAVGVSIDWATVPAAGSNTTLADGTEILAGEKYLEVGTPIDRITASGKYGPVNTNVATTDGRAVMANGETFLVNMTVKESELGSNHVPVISGGLVFKARLKVGGTDQATLANLLAAMPRLQLFSD